MTNKEIMQASLLDILFEHRNKDYGAYALRKTYDVRLLTALGTGLSVVFLLIFFALINRTDKTVTAPEKEKGIILKEYVLPKEKIKEPDPVKAPAKQKPAVKTAQVKFTSRIDIKKDNLVKSPVTSVENLKDKQPGTENTPGKPDDGTPKAPETPVTGNSPGNITVPEIPKEFVPMERDPEFPGGPAALHKFLTKNLNTPEDLEAGEKKVVKIRFKVGKDGAVNSFEIVTSGGSEFDSEVLRVCKKMPRWTPALQNGINVDVSYMIPVTFVGPE
ncbi:MAG: TonB family protein [Bacteroidota bacterium]